MNAEAERRKDLGSCTGELADQGTNIPQPRRNRPLDLNPHTIDAIEPLPYADLEAGSVIAPVEVRAFDPVTVAWTVTNQGNGTTGDGTPTGTVSHWVDRIVFSRNTVLGDTDDRLVAEVPHDGALAPGASYNAN